MALRVVLAGVLGGVVVFFWGAISHTATPLGMMGLSMLPQSREAELTDVVRGVVPADGLYFYPGREMDREQTSEVEKVWADKLAKGPYGLLLVHKEGGAAMRPDQLGKELATDMLGAFLVALLLSTTRLNYAGRIGFCAVVGLCGWINVGVPYWNWYGFPTAFTVSSGIEELVGWTLAGLVLAALVRRPKTTADPLAI